MLKQVEQIQSTYSKPAPTADTSSRVARLKKIHTRVGVTHLAGHKMNIQKQNHSDSSQKTYFSNAFHRLSMQ